MIDINDYISLVRSAIPQFRSFPPDPDQQTCILHDSSTPLIIAAGPGTGKTSTIVLRAMRLVFVNGLLPEQILITTFTNKAADEIRARLIEWGLLIKTYLQQPPPPLNSNVSQNWLNSIDINRFITGTLDSICEETLTRYRHPSDPAPVLVEGFVANAELMFNGLLPNGANNNPALDIYLAHFNFDGSVPSNFGTKLRIARTIIDRFYHDEVDMASYRANPNHTVARTCIADSFDDYNAHMHDNNKMDFAQLEHQFLERLTNLRLIRFVDSIKAILVDEYQDTNPLQENIYFELARQTNASFTVVGDDDQSLYRFRGATVELFRDFQTRFDTLVSGYPPSHLEYLINNYRSTPEIITFFNNFVQTDPCFAPARVQPPKPLISPQLPSNGIPILGLFRNNAQDLANDLASFLWDIFRGNGYNTTLSNEQQLSLMCDPNGGDFGDCVLLSHTVDELARRFGNQPPRQRLPLLLRGQLEQMGISVFNPRGRDLRDVLVVQQLLGCLLNCVDPLSQQQSYLDSIHQLRREAITYLDIWRAAGRAFVTFNPTPSTPHTLGDFIIAWRSLIPQSQMQWPNEWPILELCFKLITWLPELHDDPEGQTYLEAISRCISQAASFSTYRSSIVFDGGIHHQNSVRRAILDIFSQIAEDNVDVDEDIMPHVPRSWLQMMTIHQAKGLEFPLTIVDVSSDYQINNQKQRFRRFPELPSSVQNLENDLAPHCNIGTLRLVRSALDRTFDDLKRIYYVAYSRPQSVLLLVGLIPCLRYNTTIKHIATCWNANANWSWRQSVTSNVPIVVNNHPLLLI